MSANIKTMICAAAMCATLCVGAQESLDNTITIDRVIVPEERAATRLSVVPRMLSAPVGYVNLRAENYTAHSPLTRSLGYTAPFAWGDTLLAPKERGLAWLGYLPQYNLRAGVDYRLVGNEHTALDVGASYLGKRYVTDGVSVRENDADMSARLRHHIATEQYLTADAYYSFSAACLSLMRGYGPAFYDKYCFGVKNNRFEVGLNVGYTGRVRENLILTAAVRGGVYNYCGAVKGGLHQNNIGLSASLKSALNENSAVTFAVDADVYGYNDRTVGTKEWLWIDDTFDWQQFAPIEADLRIEEKGVTRGLVSLRPSYMLDKGMLHLSLGARVDMASKGYRSITIAPDVTVSLVPNAYFAVYAKAGGGQYVNTLRRIGIISRFIDPTVLYDNTFVPVELEAGINLGAWHGLEASINMRYLKGQDMLLPSYTGHQSNGGLLSGFDESGMTVGGNVNYDLHGRAGVSVDFRTVVSGSRNFGDFNRSDRARSVFKGRLWGKPFAHLELGTSVEYRSGRHIFSADEYISFSENISLSDYCSVSLDARFTISRRCGLFAHVDNLLGRRNIDLFRVPSQRFDGVLGVWYKF